MPLMIDINDVGYEDWETINFSSSILHIAKSFQAKGLNSFSGGYDIKAGDSCKAFFDGTLIMSGYVSKVSVDLNGTIHVTGRDKTDDLVRSQALSETVFTNMQIGQVLTDLCAPFGITVSGASTLVLPKFVVNQDETVAQAILRLATTYDLVPTAGLDGNLVLVDPASFPASDLVLREGDNISSAVLEASDRIRFQTTTALGQRFDAPQATGSATGTSQRASLQRVVLDGDIAIADCETAAAKRADYMEGQSIAMSLMTTDDSFILAGNLVYLESTTLGVTGQMLVEAAAYELSGETASTNYRLINPRGYGGTAIECKWMKS